MANGKRFFRPKPKELLGTGFDSKLEKRIFDMGIEGVSHHPDKIAYVQPRVYEPDFLIESSGHALFVETKGYFQDRNDCMKYAHIKEALNEGDYLIFVFEDPDKPMHFQAKRKDGSKMTHSEWASKNKFIAFSETQFKNELVKGAEHLYNLVSSEESFLN